MASSNSRGDDSPQRPSGQVRLVRVADDRAGQRLDNFLLGQLKGAPKPLIYKIVRSGQVRVNGGRAKAETRLEGGDEVRIPPVRLAEAGEKTPPPKGLLAALEEFATLAVEGDAPPDPLRPDLFDAPLRKALAGWQARNGLDDDGVLGPATLRRLNVPVQERLGQIEANMERWRWMPRALPADRLEIDTGGGVGALYREGRVVHAFRVIPGAVKDPSPIFQSRLNAVVLNPPWNVPDRIAREEILPKAARDPGYLARNGFVQFAIERDDFGDDRSLATWEHAHSIAGFDRAT